MLLIFFLFYLLYMHCCVRLMVLLFCRLLISPLSPCSPRISEWRRGRSSCFPSPSRSHCFLGFRRFLLFPKRWKCLFSCVLGYSWETNLLRLKWDQSANYSNNQTKQAIILPSCKAIFVEAQAYCTNRGDDLMCLIEGNIYY